MSKDGTKDIWDGDLLDYKTRGESYTRLIQSIDEGYVLSIESGFGQGKTFFAKNWAAELIQSGETVLKIDAWRSESSGDPIVTFVGKLLEALPDTGKTSGKNLKRAVSVGRNLLVASAKIGVNVVARNAAEDIIDALKSDDDDEDSLGVTALSDATRQAGNALSSAAVKIITDQLAAEEARKEIPEQLSALRQSITGNKNGRIIVIVDELDRCHPDYAISFLETMKHVFDEPGYLFVLMINSERLESLAEKRFGEAPKGEPYLDRFIDLRLGLPNSDEIRRSAVAKLVEDLPQFTPYNDHEAFSRAEAAKLAGELGVTSGLSMRKIKRTLLSVAVGIRMYPNKPIDCSLLLLFAFEISKDSQFMIKNNLEVPKISKTLEVLPRARFGPAVLKTFLESEHSDARNYRDRARKFYGTFGMLIGGNKSSQNLRNVAESYIPEHHRILSAALEVQAD